MKNLFTAGLIIIATGIVGIAIGIYDCLTTKNKAYGFGNRKPFVQVQDIRSFNRAVGKLWIVIGLLICLDGAILLLPNPESKAYLVAFSAIFLYVCGSIYYVMVIENKYKKEETHGK